MIKRNLSKWLERLMSEVGKVRLPLIISKSASRRKKFGQISDVNLELVDQLIASIEAITESYPEEATRLVRVTHKLLENTKSVQDIARDVLAETD